MYFVKAKGRNEFPENDVNALQNVYFSLKTFDICVYEMRILYM